MVLAIKIVFEMSFNNKKNNAFLDLNREIKLKL